MHSEPAGHCVQSVSAPAPEDARYVPSGHAVPVTEPATQYSPGGQDRQSDADTKFTRPVPPYLPAGHGLALFVPVPAGQKCPVAQFASSLSEPAGQTRPAVHCTHAPELIAPGSELYVPAGHSVGVAEFAGQ